MDVISSLFSSFTTGAWAVLKAVLILILAFIVAAIVKSLVIKLLTKTKLGNFLKKADETAEGGSGSTVEFIGKLVYLLVFLLFVPGIFSALGMDSISSPILSLLETIWGYVPNILAAAIILIVGFLIAKLVRQLLIPVFDKLKINKLQEKAGIEVSDTSKLSSTLAYIIYVLILIPVIIMALQALNIRAISEPAISMLQLIFNFIPNILVALIIIVIGCMIGKFGGQIVTRLIASAGLDSKLSKLAEGKTKSFSLSKTVGIVVQVVIVIFFVVESFSVLHLQVLTNIGAAIISYMPYVLSAILILAICFFAASAAEKALRKTGAASYATFAKVAILAVGGFMALNQLGIASKIVDSAFILILAALAVAFAIAFGIGGREFASKALKKLEDKNEKPEEKK